MTGVIVSRANKALVVPFAASQLFPGAPAVGNGLVVPHDLRSTLLLNAIGYKVPHPMLAYYDWCGGTPFNVQKITCAMATLKKRAYILNDMGTGKTRGAAWAWDWLNKEGHAKKLLVVCTRSNLNQVWGHELFSVIPHRRVAILGTPKKSSMSRARRLELLASDADIYVINHDGLRTIADEIEKRPDIDTLIIDELAAYRNNSERSKHLRRFAKRFEWVWGMTGEPMPNEPTDVWSQCQIVTPNTVPKYFTRARDILMTRVREAPPKYLPKPDAEKIAFSWMQPAVRFCLDDVVELPDMIKQWIDVPMTAEQEKVYKMMARQFVAMVKNKTITAVNGGVAMDKLLQVSGGWVYTNNPEFVKLDASNRIETCLDLVENATRKAIVFVPYRHMLEGLSAAANARKPFIHHAVIHGDTEDRDTILNDFEHTTKYKALFAHPATTHHGLTLVAANTIIWYCARVALAVYNQANARVRRVGQTHKQLVYHLQGSAVERKVYRMLETKDKTQINFLAMFEEATGNLS